MNKNADQSWNHFFCLTSPSYHCQFVFDRNLFCHFPSQRCFEHRVNKGLYIWCMNNCEHLYPYFTHILSLYIARVSSVLQIKLCDFFSPKNNIIDSIDHCIAFPQIILLWYSLITPETSESLSPRSKHVSTLGQREHMEWQWACTYVTSEFGGTTSVLGGTPTPTTSVPNSPHIR